MALPVAGFYTSTGGTITTHDFGSVEAGAYKPDSSGWSFRLYNAYGSTSSDTMTSVKVSTRDDDGGIDEIWTMQHWIQLKSNGSSTGSGIVDDTQTVFTPVGKNKELACGNIPSGEYRTLFARCYPPTDAAEQDVDFQLRVTYQQPATSIAKWVTDLQGDGVVASTGTPFAMSTGGSSGEIPYVGGYALINNNEIYFGSSGTFDCSTGSDGTNTVYLTESGSFAMTTGSVAVTQLPLYEVTISSGTAISMTDMRVYLAGLQAGTTGAMPSTPDLGDLYLDTANGNLYGAKTAGSWTQINSTGGAGATTFLGLTDTPSDYSGDASKLLRVNSSSGAVEFVSSTGVKLDNLGTPDDNTDLNATTGTHGLLLKMTGTATDYLSATGGWTAPSGATTFVALTDTPADFLDDANKILRVNSSSGAVEFVSTTGIATDTFGPLTDIITNNATTGKHGFLLKLGSGTSNYLRADGTWQPPPGATGGEANTASNQGTSGISIYYQKSGIDLQFKGISSTGNILVTDSTGTITVNLDVDSTGILLDNLGDAEDNTDLDASTGHHGLLPKLTAVATDYLSATGGYTAPAGGGGDVYSSGAFTAGTLTEISTTGGNIIASPFTVTTGDVFDFGAHSAVFTEQAIATTTGTAAINWNNGLKALFTRSTGADGMATFSFTAPVKSANLMLTIQNSSVGSTGSVIWPVIKWQDGSEPTLTTGASAVDTVSFYYSTGLTSYLGMDSLDFST